MSRDSRIEKSNQLLLEAEAAVISIRVGASNGGDSLSHLHQKLDDSIDVLYKKQQPCCPILMKKLKAHRLFIKRWLANQTSTSPTLA